MKLSKFQHRIYDIVISILAAIAAFLVLIDLSQGLNKWLYKVDQVILFIFLIDYVVRLFLAEDKKKYVLTNICDLIAILPFHTIFRLFKMASVARFAKLPRLFAFMYRPLKKALRFFDTNGFKYMVFVTTIMIITGGILIHFAEGMSYGDGIWWAFVTTTTVGYGDISPSTFYGRVIAMVLMLLGIGLLGTITSTLTSYFLNPPSQPKGVRDETIESIKNQLDHFDELSGEDVDDICRILKALKHSSRRKGPS